MGEIVSEDIGGRLDKDIATMILQECENIEKDTGFGNVEIIIQNGKVHHIKHTHSLFVEPIDNKQSMCYKR